MLQNAYLLAKIGTDTAENERSFAEILPIGRRVAVRRGRPAPRSPSAARGSREAGGGGPERGSTSEPERVEGSAGGGALHNAAAAQI